MSKDFENKEDQFQESEELRQVEETTEKKTSLKKELLSLLFDLAIVFAIVFLVINFVGIRTSVIGRSMDPTLKNNDQLIIDKLSYRFSDPKRFDIVVFPNGKKDAAEKYYIKRIIGLPGEMVKIENGNIYIDGSMLDDPYAYGVYTKAEEWSTPRSLGEDEYFVLGDNRAISLDSRYAEVGPVKGDIIVGKAILRIFPFKSFGRLK